MPKIKSIPFPKAIGFIIANEFCERFCFYGMRAILALYLRNKLSYGVDGATIIFHVFTMFAYFFPLIGAFIADGWIGRYKTILYLSLIYATGSVLLSVSSIPTLGMPKLEFAILSLMLIAFGTGGIKPCVSAFGGDQFKIPEQEKQLGYFFSMFYFSINAGSLISTFITPIFRKDVHCFNENDCFPLAFGVPGILMVVALACFFAGRKMYIIKNPTGNILTKVCQCIAHAITTKVKSKTKRDHWLDHADNKFDTQLIEEIKALLRVLLLYLPLPMFWALFDQQGSRWTFQADRMKFDIGSWELKADQMQVFNPFLILIFIPLFEVFIYPAMTWARLISKPLHRMIWGGFLAALAFCVSGLVELQLLPTYGTPVTAGFSQLRIYNGYNCNFTLNYDNQTAEIGPLSIYRNLEIPAIESVDLPYSLKAQDTNSACAKAGTLEGTFKLNEATAHGYFINATKLEPFKDNNTKAIDSVNVRFLANIKKNVYIRLRKNGENKYSVRSHVIDPVPIIRGAYDVVVDGKAVLKNFWFGTGAVYAINIYEDDNSNYIAKTVEVTPPNTVHILWLVPQYVIITMGEVMFSVTGLEFSFTQAPISMKSVLQSAWLLTVAFGNLLVAVIVRGKLMDAQWKEFFMFAGIMVLDMLIFTYLALRYKYVMYSSEELPVEEIKLPEKKSTNDS